MIFLYNFAEFDLGVLQSILKWYTIDSEIQKIGVCISE